MRRQAQHLWSVEWLLLILGLLAIDGWIWANTTSAIYQAYADWAFDQKLRGLTPTASEFIAAELGWDNATPPLTPPEGEERRSASPAPKQPEPSSVIGRVRIPRLGLSAVVREGADEWTLGRAVGHIPGTALPGAAGNAALAGHRDTFFRSLRNIRDGDIVTFETEHGVHRYIVKSTDVVGPRDVGVLKASSGGPALTLVTCYPFYYVGSAPKRFIVRALEVTASSPRQPQPNS